MRGNIIAIENIEDESLAVDLTSREVKRSRIIPTHIKLEVWKRDQGRCVTCGATDELHFDHILPYSKGGTSLITENIQLLCARHNLQKSAKIQ
jgi:5-methylcytosine-specific restriction endonuclease McrA